LDDAAGLAAAQIEMAQKKFTRNLTQVYREVGDCESDVKRE